MRVRHVAVVGADADAVLVGVRHEVPARVVLLHAPEGEKTAREARALLEPFGMPVALAPLRGPVVAAVLRAVTAEARAARAEEAELHVHVGGGHGLASLAALAAAALNGARAFAVADGRVEELPGLRLPFDEVVSGSKMEVLRALDRAGGSADSLQVLSDLTGEDKSLLSYHLRGTRDAKGLEELGLVDIDRGSRGRLIVRLTLVGRAVLEAERESRKGL